MKTGKQKKAGFTLVELMVVAIIVAILAAVAIPLMTGNKNRAMATEAQAACSTISTQLRVYKAEHGDYNTGATDPHDLQGINAGDLEGKYFADGDYAMVTAAGTFAITGTASAGDAATAGIIVTLDQDGVWGGANWQ